MPHPIRVVRRRHMHFYVFKDIRGQYRWALIAGNNLSVAVSGEGYVNKADCLHGLNITACETGAGMDIQFAPGIVPVNPPSYI
jgi:uncharacterized protein YegP (UPF0339 family)